MKKILYCFLLLACACQGPSENSTYRPVTERIVKISKKELNQYKAIFIIPSSGCTGCISTAEDYLINHHNDKKEKNVLFVITGHDSLKSAKIRLGEKVVNNPDVVVDVGIEFDWINYLNQYPKLLILENGMVVSEKHASPDQPEVYEELNKILNYENI